jgi:hypothetical protein
LDALNFPSYTFDIREQEQKKLIFDIARKKFIPLTPEEWVRQHVIAHCIEQYNISPNLISVEREIRFNSLKKRFDVVVYNQAGHAEILIECKAPEVKISTETVLQAGMYNKTLNCPWLYITNGLQHFWFYWNNEKLIPAATPETWPVTKP